jgi:cytoskeletal protein RodZ
MKKQSGFAVLEIILILVIIGIIGFTGWYVWHSKQNTDKTLNDTSNSSQSNPATGKKSSSNPSTTTTPKLHTAQEAVNFVQDVYSSYVKASTNSSTGEPTGSTVALNAIKSDLTSDFYSKAQATNGYDPILCAQDIPLSVSTKLSSSTQGNATVNATTTWGSSSPQTFPVTVDLTSLKISAITCQ